MAYENELRLIGNLGADPEVIQEGIVKLCLAQSKKWRDRETGQPQEKVEWFYITVFGQSAKFASDHFVKGMTILVKAGLKNSKWVDSNGETRHAVDIVVSERGHEVQILSVPKNHQPKAAVGNKPKAKAEGNKPKNHLKSQPNKASYSPPPQHGNDSNWNSERPFGYASIRQ